jgi:hypothetical protein
MQVIDKMKLAIGHSMLKKFSLQLERERTDPDIHRSPTVGILYDATDRDEFELVREFFKDLRQNRIKAVSLGYINYKETLSFHPLARPEADYFFKSQLNWLNRPQSSVVDHFISEPFDMLIHLSLKDFFPLDYIAATSRAGLKIGRAGAMVSYCYDMTFALDKSADLKTFAYTIIHYLSNINHERSTSHSGKRSSHYYTV